jgi:hypothetical protein
VSSSNSNEPPKSVDDEATSHAEPSKADGRNDTNNDACQVDGDSTDAAAAAAHQKRMMRVHFLIRKAQLKTEVRVPLQMTSQCPLCH